MSSGSPLIKNCPHLTGETLIHLEEARSKFPYQFSRPTIERWIRGGSNGVVLETTTIGARRFTSLEAIERFITAQAAG